MKFKCIIFFNVIFNLVLNTEIIPCSFTAKPVLTPDFTETIFFGYAESYVTEGAGKYLNYKDHGIRFKAIEILQAPQIRKSYDVYPYSFNSMCVDENERESDIKRLYPLGKYYLVVAGKISIFNGELLKSRNKMSQGIAVAEFNGKPVDLNTQMDYKVSAEALPTCKMAEVTDSCLNSLTIEQIMYRIDLFRLFKETSQEKRATILRRLLHYVNMGPRHKEYLIRIYISDQNLREQILKEIPMIKD